MQFSVIRRKTEVSDTVIETERNKFLVKNRFMEKTSRWQKIVLEVIEIRRLYMVKRAKHIKDYKLTAYFNRTDLI